VFFGVTGGAIADEVVPNPVVRVPVFVVEMLAPRLTAPAAEPVLLAEDLEAKFLVFDPVTPFGRGASVG